jgi:hypothetical protein
LAYNQASPLPEDSQHLHHQFEDFKTTLSNVTGILPFGFLQKNKTQRKKAFGFGALAIMERKSHLEEPYNKIKN